MANWYVGSEQYGKVQPWGGFLNYLLQSEALDNASWVKLNATVTAGFTDPNGGTAADKIFENTTNGNHQISQTIAVAKPAAALNYTASGWFKAAERSRVVLMLADAAAGTNGAWVVADLTNGVVVTSGVVGTGFTVGGCACIPHPTAAGFYRVVIWALTSTATTLFAIARVDNGTAFVRSDSYAGVATNGIIGWGLQLEPGCLATKYTATTTAAAVTTGGFTAAANDLRRPTRPNASSERVYRCTAGGVVGASEPSEAGGNPWNLTHGGTTTDGAATWTEVTGQETLSAPLGTQPWLWPYARPESLVTLQGQRSVASVSAVAAGGTGYAVGNIIKGANAGSFGFMGDDAVFKVNSVSAGAITNTTPVSVLSGGAYTQSTVTAPLPTTAVTGTGSGATLTVTFTANFFQPAGTTVENVYVASDHYDYRNESVAGHNVHLGGPINSQTYIPIISVDPTGSTPPTAADVKPGATMTSGGTQASSSGGNMWVYGVTFKEGVGSTVNTLPTFYGKYERCTFLVGSTAAAGGFIWNNNTQLRNCTLGGYVAGQTTGRLDGSFEWIQDPGVPSFVAYGGSVSTFFTGSTGSALNANSAFRFKFQGVDFSPFATAKAIFGSAISGSARFDVIDCKFQSAATLHVRGSIPTSSYINLIHSPASGNLAMTEHRFHPGGDLLGETTVVRTGGATDGTTPYSWAITTVNTTAWNWYMPFEVPQPIVVWNDVTGAVRTVTIELASNTALTEDDVWADVTYAADASSPQSSIATSRRAFLLGTPTALTTSAAAWGGAPANKYKLVIPTPNVVQQKGYFYIYLRISKLNATIYVDPVATLS